MKKSINQFVFVILISSFFLISCNPKKNTEKYTQLPKDLADLCIQIDNNPLNADLYTKRAEYYITKKQIDSAFKDGFKALQLDSSNSKRYCFLSDIYFMKGDFDASEDLLERAFSKNPNDAEAILKLAELNLYYKRYKEMNDYIDKVLTIDQRNPKAHLIKGFGLIEQTDTVSAVREFQLSVDQDPNYYEAYIQLGLIFHRKHNKIALDYYNNALKVRPKSTEAMYNIAMFFQDHKDYNRAIEQYKILLQIDSKNRNALHNLGWIEMEINKNYPTAVTYFSQSIQADSLFINAIYNRGVAYEKMKKYSEANLDYRKALQIDPNYDLASEAVVRLKKLGIK
jgi:tetratricopeptide (TPR) repeat protein